MGWFEYIMTPYREHFLPVWRIWYYITWSEVGVDPWLWHVGITSVHAFSAVCLFFILRRYLHDLGAAATGSLLWASCSFGRMDNTLNWIAASHFTFGVAWMLAASACLTRFHGKQSLAWAAAMCVCLTTSIGSMRSMIILAPLLPLQYWLLERREKPEITHFRACLADTGGFAHACTARVGGFVLVVDVWKSIVILTVRLVPNSCREHLGLVGRPAAHLVATFDALRSQEP